VKAETSEEKLRSILRKQFFVVAGLSQEELEKMDVTSMSDEELKNIMNRRLSACKQRTEVNRKWSASAKRMIT